MPTSALMSIGTSAMYAAYAQLNAIGHNIANANTPGYSRQQAVLTTSGGQFTGSGFVGRGVTVQTVERASDIFLTQQAAATRAQAAADAVRRDMLGQLEQVFGQGDAGLGMAATRLFNAFADLAVSPADLSARQTVLARAEDVAALVRSNAGQLDLLQANVRTDVANAVNVVNTLAAKVAEINRSIAAALGSGHSPNDLLDARDELIRQISDQVEVQTVGAADGTMSVFIAGGQSLVLGTQANRLLAATDPADPSRSQVQIEVAGETTPLSAAALGGGALYGLLSFQDLDLAEARLRLNEVVTGLADAMNRQQSYGLDLNGSPGTALFAFQPGPSPAGGLYVALADPRGIAAASPLTAVPSSGNLGTASVRGLAVTSTLTAAPPLDLRFTSDAGDYEIRDGGGAVLSSGTWTPGSPIAYGGFELSLLGWPKGADVFRIEAPSPANVPMNNGNALAFDALAGRALVGGATVTDAYAALLADLGNRTQGAMISADSSSATAARVEQALAGRTGVNLDEEAARLIQYQQAYQAAAKMLQTAQTVIDTLLEIGR